MTPNLEEIMKYETAPHKEGKFIQELYLKAPDSIKRLMNLEMVELFLERGFEDSCMREGEPDKDGNPYEVVYGHLDLADKGLVDYMHQGAGEPFMDKYKESNRKNIPGDMVGEIVLYEFNQAEMIHKKYVKYLIQELGAADGPLELATVFEVWLCPNCSHRNLEEWDACDGCGWIAVEKQMYPNESSVRSPKDRMEIFQLEGVPPSFEKVRQLMEVDR